MNAMICKRVLMEELTVSSLRGTVICCAIWILFSAMVGGN